jgi:PAS domain S-box-containing protein
MQSPNSDMQSSSSHQNNDEALQTLQAYRAAVNEAAIVSITDLKGTIIYVNQKFIEVSKYGADELLGQNHRLVNSGHHPKEFFRGMWHEIGNGRSWRAEIKNKAKDGSFYWVDTVITPMLDNNGKIYQYLSIRNVITAQKENEERLLTVQHEIIKREHQLKDAQKVAKTGSWYLTVTEDTRLEWSEETYRIFEIYPGVTITFEKFLECVHPDDREMVVETWKQSLNTGAYHVEHRIITKSGEKWVSERARFEFDKTENLRYALGTVQDITEKKKIEQSLRDSEQLYKTLFNTSPFAIGIIEMETYRVIEVNETATRLYGYSKEEFKNMTLFDIRVPEEHDQLTKQLSGNNYTQDRSIRKHRNKKGEIIYVEPSISSMVYKGRNVYLITVNDISAKVSVEKKLSLAERSRQKDIIEAEEKSRSQIGMELHDNVNQLLIASRLHLDRVAKVPEESQALVKTAMEILTTAIDEVRKLSATLVTPILTNNNLQDSINDLLVKSKFMNAGISVKIEIDEEYIPEGLKTNIYRIIQELFSNIIKHSQADTITLSLVQDQNVIDLEITDNGVGFDVNQARKGIGLTNIMYRARAYGGEVIIESGINKGCKTSIRFDHKILGGTGDNYLPQ